MYIATSRFDQEPKIKYNKYVQNKGRAMDISYSELRQNLKSNILKTHDKHEPIFITSHKKRQAVLISYEDYTALEETAYLLRSPKMAQRLTEAYANALTRKNLSAHALIEDEA